MITEKFNAALNDLGSLAGTVPAEVWERLSPIHAQLRGIQEPLGLLECLSFLAGEKPFVTCPEDGPHPDEPVSFEMCLPCEHVRDCWRDD